MAQVMPFSSGDEVIAFDGGGIPMMAPIAAKFKDETYRRDVPEEIVKVLVIPAKAKMSRPQDTNRHSRLRFGRAR